MIAGVTRGDVLGTSRRRVKLLATSEPITVPAKRRCDDLAAR
jgi:hypothetical protein